MVVTAIVIGAGSRGRVYSTFAVDFPDRLKIVGVAEPREYTRKSLQAFCGIPEENLFSTWDEAAARGKIADVAIITTPDRLHKDPAVRFAELGYQILLEKPIAVSEEESLAIVEACKKHQVLLCVCHVLRYAPSNRKIKEIIDSGRIGSLVNIQHMEPVGYFHFAHSFVRGNWRKESESSFSLLAKSCHDVDLIRYWVGSECTQVSSFGGLHHFTAKNKPEGAASRCVDCQVSSSCPYSALKYREMVLRGHTAWPVNVITEIVDLEHVDKALQSGPYGRCVYACDNDVADHQVVNFEFENGVTASFTMIAFTKRLCQRETKVFGTRGQLISMDDGKVIEFDFLTQKETIHECIAPPGTSRLLGHGGSDFFLLDAFVNAVEKKDPSLICTDAVDAYESSHLVFMAEKSRREGRVVKLDLSHQ